jgi:chromosome partitioning protein
MPRVKIIAVINQKGGVGKTTTVANLGAALAQSGRRVCLIDLDPQSHLTLHYGIEPGPDTRSVYDLLTGGADLAAVTTKVNEQLSVVSSTIDLAAAEVELVGTVGREQILRDHLRQNPLPYDLVLIDCPPSLGLLTLNALAAADEVVIPLQPHFLALQGLGKLLETVALVQRRINPILRVSGVILCMYESSTKLSGEVLGDLQKFLAESRTSNQPWSGARIFNTVIRRNIKLAECPSYGTTIFEYEPHSNGATDYRALAEEFLSPAPAEPAVEPAPENPAAEPSPQPTNDV